MHQEYGNVLSMLDESSFPFAAPSSVKLLESEDDPDIEGIPFVLFLNSAIEAVLIHTSGALFEYGNSPEEEASFFEQSGFGEELSDVEA